MVKGKEGLRGPVESRSRSRSSAKSSEVPNGARVVYCSVVLGTCLFKPPPAELRIVYKNKGKCEIDLRLQVKPKPPPGHRLVVCGVEGRGRSSGCKGNGFVPKRLSIELSRSETFSIDLIFGAKTGPARQRLPRLDGCIEWNFEPL